MFPDRFPFQEVDGGIGQQSGDENTRQQVREQIVLSIVMAGYPLIRPSFRPLNGRRTLVADGPVLSASSPGVIDL